MSRHWREIVLSRSFRLLFFVHNAQSLARTWGAFGRLVPSFEFIRFHLPLGTPVNLTNVGSQTNTSHSSPS
jgi:hypothetical protein